MVYVAATEGEHVEKLLRRFKKKVEASGILKDARQREYYLKPSIRKKLKMVAAAKRRRRSDNRGRTSKRTW